MDMVKIFKKTGVYFIFVLLLLGVVIAADFDSDSIDDSLDNCFDIYNPTEADEDNDGIGNACDWKVEWCSDIDDDGIADAVDNCLTSYNLGQEDNDLDGQGDVCDDDDDNDGIPDETDNCPLLSNFDQADGDNDRKYFFQNFYKERRPLLINH